MDELTIREKLRRAARDAKFRAAPTLALSFGDIEGHDIQEVIGRGGQARVFKAVQRSTGRTVAIKILLAGQFADLVAKRRFEREAKLLASLNHPHIVPLIDQGQTASGTHYFTMPFVDGRPFNCMLDDERVDRTAMLAILAKTARAVHACHEAGVIHRDLKPENILVDRFGHPHVLDFGLARPLVDSWHEITRHGNDIGTLLWTSPEQLRGDRHLVGPGTDIYSLGVILYQCLSGGVTPFSANTSLAETIRCILETNAPPPCEDLILNGIVSRAMSKKPADRYPTAAALADAIETQRTENGRPITQNRLRRFFIFGLIAVGVGSGLTWQRGGQPAARLRPTVMLPMVSTINSVGMKLVRLPAGNFEQERSDFSKVQDSHRVAIEKPFWIAATETTRRQWRSVMDSSINRDDSNLPIDDVTYSEATDFCARLSLREKKKYRLPTATEWEYAARAGGHAGDLDAYQVPNDAWCRSNSGHQVHQVGQLAANAWELHDMLGNVGELCDDSSLLEAAPSHTNIYLPLLTVRGGNFDDSDESCTTSRNVRWTIEDRDPHVGFRVVVQD